MEERNDDDQKEEGTLKIGRNLCAHLTTCVLGGNEEKLHRLNHPFLEWGVYCE